ncbi:PucR family transcriptional regulator [Nocardia puris]|uniref:PucR-like helix-turn-helix protein n=1 Tax=Nocardia puris TaxID=208602 RepID=A0A366E547_9NOCA|nr:helix-turn-helix domain-containing protein [Nocardia puris]RBO96909.1 PucR-like helix-turn-helix protein [Nocardia puris]
MTQHTQIASVHLLHALRSDLDAISEHVTTRIEHDGQDYGDAVLGHDELRTLVTDNTAALLDAMAGTPYSLEPARRTGRLKAERGVPLDSVLHAFRVAGLAIWEVAVDRAGGEDRPGLPQLSTLVWATVDKFSLAAAEAHRRAAGTEDRRPKQLLLRVLLDPDLPAAQREGLPEKMGMAPGATFALLVGDVRVAATGVTTVRTLIGDDRVTLVAAASSGLLDHALSAITARSGASRPFTDLRCAPVALDQARLALRCSAPSENRVHAYASSPVRALLAAHPDLTSDVLADPLAALATLPAADADALVETALAWYELGGSTTAVGKHLHLHRNTVLHRLNRIERLTGKAFAVPAEAALLYLTLQARLLSARKVGDPDT